MQIQMQKKVLIYEVDILSNGFKLRITYASKW